MLGIGRKNFEKMREKEDGRIFMGVNEEKLPLTHRSSQNETCWFINIVSESVERGFTFLFYGLNFLPHLFKFCRCVILF